MWNNMDKLLSVLYLEGNARISRNCLPGVWVQSWGTFLPKLTRPAALLEEHLEMQWQYQGWEA